MRERITSFAFAVVLLAFFILVVIVPKDEEASVQENRPLAKMPEFNADTLFSGTYTSDFETYVTDNVGFRSKFVRLGTQIENIRGIQKKDTGKVVDLPAGRQIALNDGKIMTIFEKDTASMQRYADVLNQYSEKFSDKADMYLMLVPTQIEFDRTEYSLLSDSQKKIIDETYASLNNFKTVNVYDKLKNNTDEYIYFRTDHHWTQRGAYYGYESLMEEKGEISVRLEDMKANRKSGFLGYLYNQANVPEYSEYADDIEYFECGENYSFKVRNKGADENMVEYRSAIYSYTGEEHGATYGIFMGGDFAFAEIDTKVNNGETALIIKDSYANAVIPFLTNHYQKILVVDPRSFDGTVTQLTEEYEIDDIIFINYAIITSLPDVIEHIERIM